MRWLAALPTLLLLVSISAGHQQDSIIHSTSAASHDSSISPELFNQLEELSRIVDIAYCVNPANPGIAQPFDCLSRCSEFPSFQLITTWFTGSLLTDSAGYIALSHAPAEPRIVVAFRGTYSLANTIIDLATIPQAYAPYPGSHHDANNTTPDECANCTVHTGFYNSYLSIRGTILPHVLALTNSYPTYQLHIAGHSLGGAIATLTALELEALSYGPIVTTYGEPRIGNQGLAAYIDARFDLDQDGGGSIEARYRRVTHRDDPVPLLPLSEWGYVSHAGEVFINKPDLSPETDDLVACKGDDDIRCIAGQEGSLESSLTDFDYGQTAVELEQVVGKMDRTASSGFGVPSRFKLWQLLFAHRDYFWRLGLCVPQWPR